MLRMISVSARMACTAMLRVSRLAPTKPAPIKVRAPNAKWRVPPPSESGNTKRRSVQASNPRQIASKAPVPASRQGNPAKLTTNSASKLVSAIARKGASGVLRGSRQVLRAAAKR